MSSDIILFINNIENFLKLRRKEVNQYRIDLDNFKKEYRVIFNFLSKYEGTNGEDVSLEFNALNVPILIEKLKRYKYFNEKEGIKNASLCFVSRDKEGFKYFYDLLKKYISDLSPLEVSLDDFYFKLKELCKCFNRGELVRVIDDYDFLLSAIDIYYSGDKISFLDYITNCSEKLKSKKLVTSTKPLEFSSLKKEEKIVVLSNKPKFVLKDHLKDSWKATVDVVVSILSNSSSLLPKVNLDGSAYNANSKVLLRGISEHLSYFISNGDYEDINDEDKNALLDYNKAYLLFEMNRKLEDLITILKDDYKESDKPIIDSWCEDIFNNFNKLIDRFNYIDELYVGKDVDDEVNYLEPNMYNLIFLPRDNGNYYIFKDFDSVSHEYYKDIYGFLLSLRAGDFRNTERFDSSIVNGIYKKKKKRKRSRVLFKILDDSNIVIALVQLRSDTSYGNEWSKREIVLRDFIKDYSNFNEKYYERLVNDGFEVMDSLYEISYNEKKGGKEI